MKYAMLASVAVLAAGCQQPTGPGTAATLMPPGLPLNSTTRVPPPPTGHVGAPNPYVQSQAAAAPGMPASDLVASTVAPQSAQGETSGAASDNGPLQTVSYVESSMGPAMAAPSIPPDAFVGDLPQSVANVPLRPHLRGMEPIDLVPVQEAAAGDAATVGVAAVPPSTAQAYRPTSADAAGDSWGNTASTDAVPSTEPRAAGARGAASSEASATQSVGDSLPWRKPSTAR